MSRRRVRAIVRKELREYRRNRSIVSGMAIFPLIFLVQPLVSVFANPASVVAAHHRHELAYMLAVPALVPATLAAYAVVGERQQGTLEPVLSTPIRSRELLLSKAIAVLLPSVMIAYVVFALFVVVVVLFGATGVASALFGGQDVLAQLIFTPLIAGWSIWLGLAVSTRAGEVRVAQQLVVLASLPTIAVTTLIAVNVIHSSFRLVLGLGIALLVANRIGWRLVAALFDRERLIAGTR